MEKVCVFCGKKIEVGKKTKEHVLPKWLIEMTGRPKRNGFWGYDYNKVMHAKSKEELGSIEPIVFPFEQFTFPACKSCNQRYGIDLETKAKDIVEKVAKQIPLSYQEIEELLDWFDKVRIGIWLGYLYLFKDLETINPHFHIDSRIGKKDRVLLVYKCEEGSKGLAVAGPGGKLFSMHPSCFMLRINDYFFVIVSNEWLLWEYLGFPYPFPFYFDENGDWGICGMQEGNKYVSSNNQPYFVPKTSSVCIFQPIFKSSPFLDDLNDSYVEKFTDKEKEGIGSIFIKHVNGSIIPMEKDGFYSFDPPIEGKSDELFLKLGLGVADILIHMAERFMAIIESGDFPIIKKNGYKKPFEEAIEYEKICQENFKKQFKKENAK